MVADDGTTETLLHGMKESGVEWITRHVVESTHKKSYEQVMCGNLVVRMGNGQPSACNNLAWGDTHCPNQQNSNDYRFALYNCDNPTLTINPYYSNDAIFTLRNYTSSSGHLDPNNFQMENDFNPTITTNAVADMYRLTHLTPPTQVKTAPTLSSNTYTGNSVSRLNKWNT